MRKFLNRWPPTEDLSLLYFLATQQGGQWGTRGMSLSGGTPLCCSAFSQAKRWVSLGFIARGRGLESHLSGNDRSWSPRRGHSLFSEPLGRSFRCSLSSQERERPALAPAEHVRGAQSGVSTLRPDTSAHWVTFTPVRIS